MKKLHPFITATLLMTFVTSSIYGQDPNYQEDGEYSSAYIQSHNSAHWTVYIPITILVGAAIWFGLADRRRQHQHSSDTQDALGSIDNSKRHASCDGSSGSYYRRSSSRTRGSYSH
jgi:hypothetical protein